MTDRYSTAMNDHITLLTACNGTVDTIHGLFSCLTKQTVFPKQIILLVYTEVTKQNFEQFVYEVQKNYPSLGERLRIVSAHNSSHQPGHYHGYDRNFLIEQLGDDEGLVLMIDNDNEVEDDFIESLIEEYIALKHPGLLAPTVMRRRSGRIQSQGITGFSFLIPKYRFAHMSPEQSPQQISLMGGNCFFGYSQYFKTVGFDPRFAYSYEDIDFTYRLGLATIPLYVTATIVTYHMESQRSALDHKLIGNSKSAYYRMRNFVLFVKKNGTFGQKIQAFGFGVWGLYIWFIINVLVYGGKERGVLLKSLTRGLIDGLMYKDLDATMEQMHG